MQNISTKNDNTIPYKIKSSNRNCCLVYFNKFQDNLETIKQGLDSKTAIMFVIKANGYGLGAVNLAKWAEETGIDYLAVANAKEATELKNNEISLPTLILSEQSKESLSDTFQTNISYTVFTEDYINTLNELSQSHNQISNVHLKVDTGMSRLGCKPQELEKRIEQINNASNLNLEGIYTHLATANTPNHPYTQHQHQVFEEALNNLSNQQSLPPYIHIANSGGVKHYPNFQHTMVRVGLSLYKNIYALESYVSALNTVSKETSIGYDTTYTTDTETTIAILPIGYADGIPESLANNGIVTIQDKPYPIVGKICMDMMLVNIGNNTSISIGDKVTIISDDESAPNSMQNISEASKRNLRSISTLLGNRIERRHIK